MSFKLQMYKTLLNIFFIYSTLEQLMLAYARLMDADAVSESPALIAFFIYKTLHFPLGARLRNHLLRSACAGAQEWPRPALR